MTTPYPLYISDLRSTRALVKAASVTPNLKKQGSERLSAYSRANSSWKAGMAIFSPILSTLHLAYNCKVQPLEEGKVGKSRSSWGSGR